MNPLITPSLLRELIRYEPDTGRFYWRERAGKWFKSAGTAFLWNNDNAGREVFKTEKQGYRTQEVLGSKVLAHRAAWAIQFGVWPSGSMDHINGVKYDNRLKNLREADAKLNARNAVLPISNTSGKVGVTVSESGRFAARVCNKHVGTYDTLDEAAAARAEAQKQVGGFTDRHGKPSIKEIRVRGYSLRRKLRKEAAIRNAAQQATG